MPAIEWKLLTFVKTDVAAPAPPQPRLFWNVSWPKTAKVNVPAGYSIKVNVSKAPARVCWRIANSAGNPGSIVISYDTIPHPPTTIPPGKAATICLKSAVPAGKYALLAGKVKFTTEGKYGVYLAAGYEK